MKTFRLLKCAAGIAGLSVLTAVAQPNNTQTILDGVSSNAANDLIVGQDGTNNVLILRNGASLSNAYAVVGNQSPADANEALVEDAGTEWFTEERLIIGDEGSFNLLTVTNQAYLRSEELIVGYRTGSDSNRVDVTGTGTLVSNRFTINIGSAGSHNSLQVKDGAMVRARETMLGELTGASDNTVSVEHPGTIFTNFGIMTVGRAGGSNHLEILDGAVLYSAVGQLGVKSTSPDNEVWINGSGAEWINGSNLLVGIDSTNNLLVITNGGRAVSASGIIGDFDWADGNRVLLHGTDSEWVIGDILEVGRDGADNLLQIENGARLENGEATLGLYPEASGNRVFVTGTGSLWSNRFTAVGDEGPANLLDIENGGEVHVGDLSIGLFSPTYDNTTRVSGAGSLLTVTNFLTVGEQARDNLLDVSQQGTIQTRSLVLGNTPQSSGNLIVVRNPGSSVTVSSDLLVGYEGQNNVLLVEDGGSLTSRFGFVGSTTNAVSNRVEVADSGSRLVTTNSLSLGGSGQSTLLRIHTGGTVRVQSDVFMGENAQHRDAYAVVRGSNAVWNLGAASPSNTVTLWIGYRGTSNRVDLLEDGLLQANDIVLGAFPESTENTLCLDGGRLISSNIFGSATLDVRQGTLYLKSGDLTLDNINLSTQSILRVATGFDLTPLGELETLGRIETEGDVVFPFNVDILPSGSMGGFGTWTLKGDLDVQGTNLAEGTALDLTLAFTNQHNLALPSEDRSNRLEGYEGNYALGTLRAPGTVDVVSTVYAWSLEGNGVINVSSNNALYYFDDSQWSGTINPDPGARVEQVAIVQTNLSLNGGGPMTLSWPAVPGLVFDISVSESMTNLVYDPVGTVTATTFRADWDDLQFTNRSSGQIFYRLDARP